MTNQSTIDKLIEMRLSSMADAFRIQMNDSAMKEVPFEDRFGMLVDVEYTNRKNNRNPLLLPPGNRCWKRFGNCAKTIRDSHSPTKKDGWQIRNS